VKRTRIPKERVRRKKVRRVDLDRGEEEVRVRKSFVVWVVVENSVLRMVCRVEGCFSGGGKERREDVSDVSDVGVDISG
jgi:hypothetical protein